MSASTRDLSALPVPMPGMYFAYSIDLEKTIHLHLGQDHLDDNMEKMIQNFPCRTFVGHCSDVLDDHTSLLIRVNVRPLQQGLTISNPERGIKPSMCVPIAPERVHPNSRRPAETDKPLPWPNCYHPTVESNVVIRIPAGPVDYSHAITLDIDSRLAIFSSEMRDTCLRNESAPLGLPASTVMVSGFSPTVYCSSQESLSSAFSYGSHSSGPRHTGRGMPECPPFGSDAVSVSSEDEDEDYGEVLSPEDCTLMRLSPGEFNDAIEMDVLAPEEGYSEEDDDPDDYNDIDVSSEGCLEEDDARDDDRGRDDDDANDGASVEVESISVHPCDSLRNPTIKDTTMTPVVRFTPDLSTVECVHGPLQLAEDFLALQNLIAKCKEHVRSQLAPAAPDSLSTPESDTVENSVAEKDSTTLGGCNSIEPERKITSPLVPVSIPEADSSTSEPEPERKHKGPLLRLKTTILSFVTLLRGKKVD